MNKNLTFMPIHDVKRGCSEVPAHEIANSLYASYIEKEILCHEPISSL